MELIICKAADLKEREPYTVKTEEGEIGVILADSRLYGFKNYCPHQGGPVCLGEVFGEVGVNLDQDKKDLGEYVNETNLQLVCPWHGLSYGLQTGTCNIDQNLKLVKVNVFVRGDDVVADL